MSAGEGQLVAIEALELRKRYGAEIVALDGLSLAVERGTITALVGPNGAGKSTTVKILTTLSRADSGEARVAGLDVARQPARVRHAIGVVGQKAGFTSEATARENLVMQGEIFGITGRALLRRVDELLETFALGSVADRAAKSYSGGMQRRLDVAIGLVNRPEVLFLDEPTTGLDPDARAGLWGEIAALAARGELTILLTTHYLEEADRLAKRVAIVDRGRVVVEGTPEGLKSELRGDTVHVQLRAPGDKRRLEGALAALPGLREVTAEAGSARARAEDGARAIPLLIAALEEQGFAVGAVTLARPSLEDVYLRYAGRAYVDKEAA